VTTKNRDEALRQIDDATLLDLYEQARADEDAQCGPISAELIWRGIEVQPCGHAAGPVCPEAVADDGAGSLTR